MLLSAWSADSFHSPSPMSCLKMNLRSWLCEASGAWISFSCGWQPTEIRTVDRHRKTRSYVSTNERLWLQAITKLHQKVPGRASRAIQSLSYMIYIFFFSPYPGGRGAQMIFLNGFLAFFKSWQCKTANQVVCLFILFRVFQSRATLSCFMMLKSYLWFETMFALAADLDIYIWLFTITICLFLS